jgi:uncharacterized SAM-binding protein YcdF (DUF218 family)
MSDFNLATLRLSIGLHPVLVTTGFHIKRALFCFNKVALNVTPRPCGLTEWPAKPFRWNHLLPAADNQALISAGMHAWIGRLYYLLRYKSVSISGWTLLSVHTPS